MPVASRRHPDLGARQPSAPSMGWRRGPPAASPARPGRRRTPRRSPPGMPLLTFAPGSPPGKSRRSLGAQVRYPTARTDAGDGPEECTRVDGRRNRGLGPRSALPASRCAGEGQVAAAHEQRRIVAGVDDSQGTQIGAAAGRTGQRRSRRDQHLRHRGLQRLGSHRRQRQCVDHDRRAA
jgi:hypothetical protein